MIKVSFIRHGPLLQPYNDYNKLSLNQLTELALQKVDPSVNEAEVKRRVKISSVLDSTYGMTIVSESQRTQQTAVHLSAIMELSKPIISPYINEILFDPSQLVSQVNYAEEGLQSVRKQLFKALVDGSNKEKINEVLTKIGSLEQMLKKSGKDSVLVITHGFLLRVIDLYFRENKKTITEVDLLSATNFDYVDGFSITLV